MLKSAPGAHPGGRTEINLHRCRCTYRSSLLDFQAAATHIKRGPSAPPPIKNPRLCSRKSRQRPRCYRTRSARPLEPKPLRSGLSLFDGNDAASVCYATAHRRGQASPFGRPFIHCRSRLGGRIRQPKPLWRGFSSIGRHDAETLSATARRPASLEHQKNSIKFRWNSRGSLGIVSYHRRVSSHCAGAKQKE